MSLLEKKEALRAALLKQGWKADCHGHLRGDIAKNAIHRVILQARGCRLEKKIAGAESWYKVGGDYYSKCTVFADGRVNLGNKIVGVAQP